VTIKSGSIIGAKIMKRNSYAFVACLMLFGQCVFNSVSAQTQSPFMQKGHFVGQPQNNSDRDTSASMSTLLSHATEDPSQRTLFSSSYITDDGQIIKKYSTQIVNYYDANHNLVPIQIELKSSANGWKADQQPNACYFNLDRSTGIDAGDGREIKFNINSKVNGIGYQQQIISVTKDQVLLNMNNDVHKKIRFLINGIETDYVIDHSLGNTLEVSEELDLPNGSVFKQDKKKGRTVNGMWQGAYELVATDGSQLASFGVPLCFDATGKNWCAGYYRDEVVNGKHILHTVVPADWLSTAKYPITIDPVVKGPTSHWPAGKSIPSGSYPTFCTDSLLVTIPGGITIRRFYASFCFVTAPPPRLVYFIYGRLFFKTPCAKTPIFACDTTGFPGTCYLDTLRNNNDFGPQSFFPLTCCYNPLCVPQSFYFTVGLSRDCPPSAPCLPAGPDSTQWLWSPSIVDGCPYPFYAYIVGNTDEVPNWSVPSTVCSNVCSINLNLTAQYGVPPYTITHPWAAGSTVFGTATSCNASIGTTNIQLKIPGCPTYCGTQKTISVPPPVVVDFCNDTVKGLIAKTLTINPVPEIKRFDTLNLCSGAPVTLTVHSCSTGTLMNWTGSNGKSGNDSNIVINTSDSTNTTIITHYTMYSSFNGCKGDTDKIYVKINPSPTLTTSRDTTILDGNSVVLSAATNGNTYSWYPYAGLSCIDCPNPVASPSVTTKYYVTVTGADGCTKTDSITIDVTPQDISIPNIFTPNGDGRNDTFYIHNLQYYPNSQLTVYDRWGVKVFTSINYLNTWDGQGQSDGTYYYILTLPNGKKHDGYVQILR